MKTAISIPDGSFEVAERAAAYLNIPRSQLFVLALNEYLQNHAQDFITARLNKIYGKTKNNTTETLLIETGLDSLREATKNDAW